MATEIQLLPDVTFSAGADLSAAQYKFVYLSADNTVSVCSATTQIPIGVLQNAPSAAGQAAQVRVFGKTKLQADEAMSYGQLVRTSADGQAALLAPGTDTDKSCAGIVTKGAAAAGVYAEVMIGLIPANMAVALA